MKMQPIGTKAMSEEMQEEMQVEDVALETEDAADDGAPVQDEADDAGSFDESD